MKPIPKNLLIHSAYAIRLGEPERWEAPPEIGRTKLSFLRFESYTTLRLSKTNEQVQLSGVLFYDCRNSRPKGYNFSHADKFEIDGVQYNIVGVQMQYDDKKLHHLEVELCL